MPNPTFRLPCPLNLRSSKIAAGSISNQFTASGMTGVVPSFAWRSPRLCSAALGHDTEFRCLASFCARLWDECMEMEHPLWMPGSVARGNRVGRAKQTKCNLDSEYIYNAALLPSCPIHPRSQRGNSSNFQHWDLSEYPL
jgi:hypothetical protein